MNTKSILLFAFLASTARLAYAQTRDRDAIAAVRAELEHMYETDQQHRAEMVSLVQTHGLDSEQVRAVCQKQAAIDEQNIARLQEIIGAYGWPGQRLVGKKAASAAFLVLQHAAYEYQKKYLPLVRQAVSSGELESQHLALLEDRVLMREGKKQIYGTQLTRNQQTDAWELYPIENEASVDKRRAKVGLPPLAEYLKYFGLEYESAQQ